MADYEAASGDVRVRIRGIRKAIRALESAGADTQDMKDLMHSMGMIVVSRARGLVPYKSGDLHATLRAGRGKTKAVVRAGRNSKALPYGAVIHYGWPKRNIKPQPFLADALAQTRGQVLAEFDRGLTDLLRQNGLK